MPKSQVERNKDYMTKNQIKQVKFNFNSDECNLIEAAAKKRGSSKKDLILNCVKYCEEHNIIF